MIELSKDQIKKILPMYKGHIAQELEYAYREEAPFGKVEIKVYADEEYKPNVILILGGFAGTALYGDTGNNESYYEIKKLILDSSSDNGNDIWLSLYSPNWESKLDELFNGFTSRKNNRLIHRLNNKIFQNHINWQEKIPNGYIIKKFDSSSYEFIKKRNWQDFWHPQSERFGWFLMKDDEIVSECTSVWVEKVGIETGCVEISIETKEPYRRKGYAALTSAAFINDCLSRNLIPVWCCWQSTSGSKELAEKLGFEVIENRRAIFIKP